MSNENPDTGTISDDDLDMFLERNTDNAEVEETEEAEEVQEDQAEVDAADEDSSDPEADESDEDPDVDDDEDEDDDPVVEITTKKGGTQQVPLSELKDGYLRQQDYTRGKQEIAAQREEIDRRITEISEKSAQLEARLTETVTLAPQEPNWLELAQRLSPQEFQIQKERWGLHMAQRENARQQLEQLRNEVAHEKRTAAAESLSEFFPNWRDDAVAQKEFGEARQFAQGYGISEDVLTEAVVENPAIMRIVRDAMAYQNMKSSNAATAKKVSKVAKSLQPGGKATKPERVEKQRKAVADRMRNNPNDQDAFADWLLTG